MKLLYNLMAIIFCIVTLGFVNVYIRYSDGTEFNWVGWIKRIQDSMEGA